MHLRFLSILLAALTIPRASHAAPVWVGDMETGDLSQWSGQLNGEVNGMTYLQASGEQVAGGAYAAKIELHNDAVWQNGLKRVELNHSPADGRTAEGAALFFAWSFYVPTTLPAEPSQQIGYWESNNSYQQMMAFEVSGERISFSTRKPNNVVHWDEDGRVTAGVWHRIAMRVVWSKDPGVGAVDVWFDGVQVVTAAAAQTLADDNAHFTQVGLLRGVVEFEDVPVIYIDDAVEGDNYEDVQPEPMPPDETTGGGETGVGSSGGEASSGGAATTATSTGDAPTTGSVPGGETTGVGSSGPTSGGMVDPGTESTGGAEQDDEGGCGCVAGSPGVLGVLGLLFPRRRRR